MTPRFGGSAAALLLALTVGCSGRHGPAAASRQVVYRIEDLTQATPRVTTQVVDVAAPYRARELTRLGSTSLGGLAWDAGRSYLISPTGAVQVVADVAPGFPAVDLHLDVALASALRHGLAEQAGVSQVTGKPCTVWVTHDPLDSGPLAPASGGDRTQSCVAADGTLLQDEWSLHGRVVRRRTAVSVGPGPDLSGAKLLEGKKATVSSAPPLEQVMAVPVSRLVTALGISPPAAPGGLRPDRSTALIQNGPTGQVDVEGGVLTWTDGKKLVVLRIERGLTRRLTVGTDGVPVRLGSHTGRLSAVPSGLRVRVAGGNGIVATVTSDLPEGELLRWVGALDLG